MTERYAVIPASYLYLRQGDEVLLQLRQNTGYLDGHWSAGAAGHVHHLETAEDAAIREAEEELGIGLGVGDLDVLTVLQRTDGTDAAINQRVEWFFCARTWQGTPRITEPHKCAELRWFPLADLPHPLMPHEQHVLKHLVEGTLGPLSALGFAASQPA